MVKVVLAGIKKEVIDTGELVAFVTYGEMNTAGLLLTVLCPTKKLGNAVVLGAATADHVVPVK